MTKIKLEDIVLGAIIVALISIAIWKLFGSPTDTATLISIMIFVATSEMIVWKKIFAMDKRSAVGFEKVKGNLAVIKSDVNHIKENLSEIKTLLEKKKK